jgi:hypothetical protein
MAVSHVETKLTTVPVTQLAETKQNDTSGGLFHGGWPTPAMKATMVWHELTTQQIAFTLVNE